MSITEIARALKQKQTFRGKISWHSVSILPYADAQLWQIKLWQIKSFVTHITDPPGWLCSVILTI